MNAQLPKGETDPQTCLGSGTGVQLEGGDSRSEQASRRLDAPCAAGLDQPLCGLYHEFAVAGCGLQQPHGGQIHVGPPTDGVEDPGGDGGYRVDSAGSVQPFDRWVESAVGVWRAGDCGRLYDSTVMRVAGLFAGIGGFELGFERAGHRALLLCENDEHAAQVLRRRWPHVRLHGDAATLDDLPEDAEIVAAGFPCQNLSMAGDKRGIEGRKSTIVSRLFDLLDRRSVRWVVIENVYFMLHLRRGSAIAHILGNLEERGYRWAYRVVESRAFGLAQRRRRVFVVASESGDPRDVLLADEAGAMKRPPGIDMARPVGFYWTEGRTGHGLTADAIPPLKAGSALAIRCPPAVLLPSGRVVTPTIEAVERFQGFPDGWTAVLREKRSRRHRWRLLGNAVSVPVAEWIGRRLTEPGSYDSGSDAPLDPDGSWPNAAWNMNCRPDTRRVAVGATEHPVRRRRGRISAFATEHWPDLSERALRGFTTRARKGHLKYPAGFLEALEANLR